MAWPQKRVSHKETFPNTWQAIGTVNSETDSLAMVLTTMCNIKMAYFFKYLKAAQGQKE